MKNCYKIFWSISENCLVQFVTINKKKEKFGVKNDEKLLTSIVNVWYNF